MPGHGTINYVELPSRDLAATRRFFEQAFGWRFVEYGPEYLAIEGAGLDGGFYASSLAARSEAGSALVVLYSDALEQTLAGVVEAGGEVIKPIFEFPGGRRFHFLVPGGSEFAVWSEPAA